MSANRIKVNIKCYRLSLLYLVSTEDKHTQKRNTVSLHPCEAVKVARKGFHIAFIELSLARFLELPGSTVSWSWL